MTVNQAHIEAELLRLSERLEASTAELVAATQAAAESEAAYKRAYAAARIQARLQPGNGPGGRTTDSEADDAAICAHGDLLTDRLVRAAVAEGWQESCRTLRAQLSAIQTVSANLRAQT